MDALNSPDYGWRCPCVDLPCHHTMFNRIQDLILHMLTEHALAIVTVQPQIN